MKRLYECKNCAKSSSGEKPSGCRKKDVVSENLITYPIEPFGLKNVAVYFVEFSPSSSSSTINAA